MSKAGYSFARGQPAENSYHQSEATRHGGQAPVLRLRDMEKPMKLQIAVQVGKAKVSISIPVDLIILILALLV